MFREALPRAAVFLLGFLLFAAPYLVYLRGETGTWTVSGKAKINTIVGGFDADPESVERHTQNGPVKDFAIYFASNLLEVHKALPVLFPLLLWPLVGLGLFRSPWSRSRSDREVLMVSFGLVTIAGYAAAVVQLRYLYVLLPILLGWTAAGIVNFAYWFSKTASFRVKDIQLDLRPQTISAIAVAAVFLYVLPLNFYMRTADQRWQTGGYEERDAGLWIRGNAGANSYIFSASRRPAFHAQARQLTPGTKNLDVILADIKQEKVDYVVTSERSLTRNAFLTGLDEILRLDPDFELVYENHPRAGYGVMIFRRR